MRIEVLISAMNQTDLSLAEKTGCTTDVLIINQTDHEGYDEIVINGNTVRMYSTLQRGLSRSRNMALLLARGDICLLCDDDEKLEKGYDQILLKAFADCPSADIIAFNYHDENPRAKRKLITSEKRSSKWRVYSSVALAFRRESVLLYGVWFDHRFGAGSGIISAGEESSWQLLAHKKGLVRWQCPRFITTVTQENSQWFKGYGEQYFYDLGANLATNHPNLKYILQFYYLFRIWPNASISLGNQIKCMLFGMQGIKYNLGYNNYLKRKDGNK